MNEDADLEFYLCFAFWDTQIATYISMRQEEHLCMSIRMFRNFSSEAKMLLLPMATLASGKEQEGERPRNHVYPSEFTPIRPCDHASILLIFVFVILDLQTR